MAKVIEVDETAYQNGQETIAAVQKMLAHPKAALLVEQAKKLVYPDSPTPRLDQHKQVNEPIEALQAKIDELNKKIEDKDAERDKNEKLSALQRTIEAGNAQLLTEGWTPDGIKALTEWREKKGIIDPLDAAGAYERQHGSQVAPATPSSHIGGWDFTNPSTQDEEYTKKLLETRGESESLVMQQATKSLNDFRGNNRR
jgi:hypothetical protein